MRVRSYRRLARYISGPGGAQTDPRGACPRVRALDLRAPARRALTSLNRNAQATLHTHIVEPIEERVYAERSLIAQSAYSDMLAQLARDDEGDEVPG